MRGTSIDDLETLRAKQAIRDVLALYCRAIDRLDVSLLRSVYHPGATDAHGTGEADISAAHFQSKIVKQLRESFQSTQHVLGSIHVAVEGEVAHSEAYVTAFHAHLPDEQGHTFMKVIGARYVDRFERREGVWRIARRVAVRDWQETRLIDTLPSSGTLGRRNRTDAVYVTE